MDGLQIPPHSHRLSLRAVGVLSLLALGGFATGLARQAERSGPALFPARQPAAAQALAAIPEATPAPDMQLAAAPPPPPPRHARRTEDTPEPAGNAAEAPPADPASAAAADASATAPDPAAAPAAKPPGDDPRPPSDSAPT